MEPPIKLFSVDEADRLVDQIAPMVRQLQALQQALAGAEPGGRDDLADQFDATYRELMMLGVFLKDLDLGLVDFYALHDAQVVFLCWKLGEDRVRFWHQLEDGFAGRRPL
jgi:hypothetical protein